MDFPESPFWDFSLALYGSDGVPPACLRLQERHGVDVNFLFFCIWRGLTGGKLNPDDLRARHEAIAVWHETVVRHLRALRQRLKEPVGPVDPDLAQALRARIQKIEIDAEHIEQVTLFAGPAPIGASGRVTAEGRRDAAANVSAYFALLCADLAEEDRQDVDILLTASASLT